MDQARGLKMVDNSVLIKKARAGEKEAREVLIEQNLGLVRHYRQAFLGRGYEAEDFVPDWRDRPDQGNR